MSLIEVAYELLAEKKQAISFQQLMDELAQTLQVVRGKNTSKNCPILYRLKYRWTFLMSW